MKTLLPYIIIAIAFFGIGILLTKQCSKPEIIDNSQEIKALRAQIEIKDKQLNSLIAENDSIKSHRQEIVTQTTQNIIEIDSSIAKDSTNSIVRFREALTLWGDLPDGTDYPTYRELGLSAKNMFRGHSFNLELKDCDNEVANLLNQTKVLISQKQEQEKIVSSYAESNLNLLSQLEDANSFWRSPGLWYGLGGASAILVIFLSGMAK